MLSRALRRFARADSGAITVDFVILTSAIVGLGIGVTLIVILPTLKPTISAVNPVMESVVGLTDNIFNKK